MEVELQYKLICDGAGKPLIGGKNYKFHLPSNIPSMSFWSVIVYDNQTNLIIKTDQPWPSVFSSSKKLLVNPDGSVDAYFGPEAPVKNENNWVKTNPGKGWYMILRLYSPPEHWSDENWKPNDIEEVK